MSDGSQGKVQNVALFQSALLVDLDRPLLQHLICIGFSYIEFYTSLHCKLLEGQNHVLLDFLREWFLESHRLEMIPSL